MGNKAEDLARLIQEGLASEDEKGVVLRAIHIGLGSSLATQVMALGKLIDKEMTMYQRLQERYEELLEEKMTSIAEPMTLMAAGREADRLYQRIYHSLDLARQIVQGKNLFPQDTISQSDRKVLQVIASIKTEEERKRFFTMLDHYMNIDNVEFEEIQS